MVTHKLKVSENKTTRVRSGACECGSWAQTEPLTLRSGSAMEDNYKIHVQLNKNRGNA